MHWGTFERFLPHNLKLRGKQKKWVLCDYIKVYKLDLEGGGVILGGIFSLFSLSSQYPKMKEKKLGWYTINFHCKLTKVQRDSHILHSGFAILEFGVFEFKTEWDPSKQLVCANGEACLIPFTKLMPFNAVQNFSYACEPAFQIKTHIKMWKH